MLTSEPQRGAGVIVPFDFALDRELWRWTPPELSLYLTRLPFAAMPMTLDLAITLSAREAMTQACRAISVPGPVAVAYACTSGSFVNGAAAADTLVGDMVAGGVPAATTTSGALVESLAHLDARRVAVVTPYIESVTTRLVDFLGEHAVGVVSTVDLGLISRIWEVSPRELVAAVRAADRPDADAVFISCTNLAAYDIIAPLERALGKPVLSANQVTMWSLIHAAGATPPESDQRLFRNSHAHVSQGRA